MDAIGDGEAWALLSAVIAEMMSADLKERSDLFQHAMDMLHDIMCDEFPGADDGIRYCCDCESTENVT